MSHFTVLLQPKSQNKLLIWYKQAEEAAQAATLKTPFRSWTELMETLKYLQGCSFFFLLRRPQFKKVPLVVMDANLPQSWSASGVRGAAPTPHWWLMVEFSWRDFTFASERFFWKKKRKENNRIKRGGASSWLGCIFPADHWGSEQNLNEHSPQIHCRSWSWRCDLEYPEASECYWECFCSDGRCFLCSCPE